MTDWLKSLLTSAALPGVKSRRLVNVVFGVVLLGWLLVLLDLAAALPELPGSVILLLVITLGTVALDR